MEITFAKQNFGSKLKSMLRVDFRRLFTTPIVYIMCGISIAVPILILVMTSMMPSTTVDTTTGVETAAEAFTNVWQTIGAASDARMTMGLTSMCNINLMFFLEAVFVCIFVSDDFRSGYAKNLFAVRSSKIDYVMSKSVVGYVGGATMLIMYFLGAMIGGTIAGLSFDPAAVDASVGGIFACMLSKVFMMSVFVGIYVTLSVVGKQKLWISILGSFAASMLLFTMIPMVAPLDASFLNVIMCLAGGAMFAVGMGAVSNIILNKTALV